LIEEVDLGCACVCERERGEVERGREGVKRMCDRRERKDKSPATHEPRISHAEKRREGNFTQGTHL
jgi:hypothetical protein